MISLIVTLSLLHLSHSRQFTVSGFSSGGFFAHQLHVVHSSSIKGAGIVAGGPFFCTTGSNVRFQTSCKANPYLISLQTSLNSAKQLADSNLIDNLSSLASSKVYIFSGSKDSVVTPGVVRITSQFYENFISQANIVNKFDLEAEHSWVTNGTGNPCLYLGPPGVNSCGFDLAGQILTQLYGKLANKGVQIMENLHSFDQSKFGDVWKAGMSNRGFIYIPTSCVSTPCEIHLLFHGCYGSFEVNGYSFMTEIGMNEWAESNSIVIIYPQLTVTDGNPEGCWDFFGYTGRNYNTNEALQIQIVHSISQKPPIVPWSI